MRQSTRAGRSKLGLIRIGLQPRNEVLGRLGRMIRIDCYSKVVSTDLGHWSKIIKRIIVDLTRNDGIESYGGEWSEQQCRAIGIRILDGDNADAPDSTHAILNNDGLSKPRLQLVREKPDGGITAASCRERKNDANSWTALGICKRRYQEYPQCGDQHQTQSYSTLDDNPMAHLFSPLGTEAIPFRSSTASIRSALVGQQILSPPILGFTLVDRGSCRAQHARSRRQA